MKNTFEFTEKERDKIHYEIVQVANEEPIHYDEQFTAPLINFIEQIISERITPEPGESGQSADEIIRHYCYHEDPLSPVLVITKDHALQAMRTYASQVCADKEADLQDMTAMRESAMRTVKNLADRIEPLQNEIDRLNESMTVMLRKNAELEKELEYAKIR